MKIYPLFKNQGYPSSFSLSDIIRSFNDLFLLDFKKMVILSVINLKKKTFLEVLWKATQYFAFPIKVRHPVYCLFNDSRLQNEL